MSDQSQTTEAHPTIPESAKPAIAKPPKKRANFNFGWFIIVIVLAATGYFWYTQTSMTSFKKSWQAVFLTNGQVYFGQVIKQNNSEVTIKDIYYLQVTQPLQQTQEGQQQQANTQGELSLVKLGNELHGPTDFMYVNRDQVLFIEDLKDDGSVVQAITNYKSGQQQ